MWRCCLKEKSKGMTVLVFHLFYSCFNGQFSKGYWISSPCALILCQPRTVLACFWNNFFFSVFALSFARHRRRSLQRNELHRLSGGFPAGPQDRGHHPDRRDRRQRRGKCGRVPETAQFCKETASARPRARTHARSHTKTDRQGIDFISSARHVMSHWRLFTRGDKR